MTPLETPTQLANSSCKVALIWIDLGAYHLARLRAVQERFGGNCVAIELVGGFGDQDCLGLPFRETERSGLNIITLFPNQNLEQISPLQLSQKLIQTLNAVQPEHVALCGYHRIENLVAMAWAKATGRGAILMTESKQDDAARQTVQEWLKGAIVRQFNSYLVGGIPHRDYITSLGASKDRVFEGYDVVDNTLFAEAASAVRQQQTKLRAELGLPDRYFMAACRFVEKKNLSMLLEAYRYYRQTSNTNWGLVICGGGPLEHTLRRKIATEQIPDVFFPGFHRGKELAVYYGLASCFIHPSIQEQWGLVVNEAMASGLPVLVSNQCGCVPNLVKDGVNGFTFDPTNPHQLAKLMDAMTRDPAQLEPMSIAAQKTIADYAPENFATNLSLAMKAARSPY